MKKRGLKRVLAAALTVVLLFGLTGCGKDKEGGKEGASLENAALSKEFVYSEEPFEFAEGEGDIGLRALTSVGEKIYLVYEVYNGGMGDVARTVQYSPIKLMTMDMDGSNSKVVDLAMYLPGQEPVVEENEQTAEEEADILLEESQQEAIVDDGIMNDMSLDDSYYQGTYEYLGLDHLSVSADGKLYGSKNYYYEDYSDQENPVSINKKYVCCWDADGVMLWESELPNLETEESWAYIQGIHSVGDGARVLLAGDVMEMIEVGADGTLGDRKVLPEQAMNLNYALSVVSDGNGVVKYPYWDPNGESKIYLGELDLNTMTAAEPQLLPDSMLTGSYMCIADGAGLADLAYSTQNGVYLVNSGDTEATQIMSYINSDMPYALSNFVILNDNQILGFYYDNYEYTTKGGIYTKVDPADIKDKGTLVLACNWMDYSLRERVVNYNKNSDTYRIVVKDYSQYATVDDYSSIYTKLNNDILAEGMPDILVADSGMPLDSYIAKGLVADIDKLIAEDPELSQREFMDNVFEAYRVDGKLYYVIPAFNLRTMIGKTSVVGDRNTWTMQEMLELQKTLPEGTNMISDFNRSSFLNLMMEYGGRDFVDVDTGKCDFNTENFIAMLEFAKTIPEEIMYEDDYWMTYESQYRENKTVLMNCYIGSVRDMNRYINGNFGEDISYIGFPTDSGQGSVVSANTRYMLSAKSENLQGAWEFIRYYLTEEYQRSDLYEFPVDKAVFREKAAEALERPYYINEEGEKVEYDDYYYINGEEFVLPNMTQEQLDEFVAFVEGVNKSQYGNEAINNIIREEAEAFFSGQKSARDVAGVIQSRAQVYVNENS